MGYVFKSAGMGHFQAIKQSLFILVGDFSLSFQFLPLLIFTYLRYYVRLIFCTDFSVKYIKKYYSQE